VIEKLETSKSQSQCSNCCKFNRDLPTWGILIMWELSGASLRLTKSKGRLKKYHKHVYEPAAFVSDWPTTGTVVYIIFKEVEQSQKPSEW